MAGAPTRARYGLDAPGVVVGNAAAGVAALAGAGLGWPALRRRHPVAAAVVAGWLGVWGLVAAAQAGLMVRSSRTGKLRERDRLLQDLPWRGDEWVLDVGCGRGLLLIGAAKRLTSGRAVGLDLWRRQDQAGNQGSGVPSICPVGEVGPGGMGLAGSRHEPPGSCGSHSLMTTVEARACRSIILDPIRPDRTASR